MEEIDTFICLKKQKLKKYQRNYRKGNKNRYS